MPPESLPLFNDSFERCHLETVVYFVILLSLLLKLRNMFLFRFPLEKYPKLNKIYQCNSIYTEKLKLVFLMGSYQWYNWEKTFYYTEIKLKIAAIKSDNINVYSTNLHNYNFRCDTFNLKFCFIYVFQMVFSNML